MSAASNSNNKNSSENKHDIIISSAQIKLHQATKSVFVNGVKVEIRGLSYRFLEALLKSQQQLLTYDKLSTAIWQKPAVSEEVIAQRASLVRKLIQDKDKVLFESVRGIGYQWSQPIEIEIVEKEQKTAPKAPSTVVQKSTKLLAAACFTPLIAIGVFSMMNSDETSTAKADNHSQQNGNTSLVLKRAREYGNQHTDTSNQIAITLYQQYLEQNGFERQAAFYYVQAILQRVAKFERNSLLLSQANDLIAQLEATETDQLAIYWLKGYYFDVLGDLNRAISFYEKSLSIGEQPKARAAGALAYLYTQQGKLFEATQLNIAALEGDGFYRLLQIAEIFYLIDHEPEAQRWIEHAYQLAPNESFTTVQYAKYLFAHNKIARAKDVLTTFHTLDAETEDSLVLLATLEIASANWEAARAHLKKAIAIAPNSIYVLSLYYWLEKTTFTSQTISSPVFVEGDLIWPSALVAQSMIHITNKEFDLAVNVLNEAFKKGYLDHRMIVKNPVFNKLSEDKTLQQTIENAKRALETERAKITLIELPNLSQLLLAK